MRLSRLESNNSLMIGTVEQKSIAQRVSAIGAKALQYFVRNKYALTLSVWTCALIEVSRTASDSTISENYVYDVASCRKTLCDYATKYAHANHTSEELFNLIDTCDIHSKNFSFSFIDCLYDLCTFLGQIGEKFYACVGNFSRDTKTLENQLYSDTKISSTTFWNTACPKRHFKHLTDFKKLTYFTDCLKNICKDSNILSNVNEDTLSLCTHTNLEDFHNTLKLIKRYLRQLVKAAREQEESQNWDKSNAITNIIISITGIISSVAAVGTTMIAYRSGGRVAVAVKKTSDSLNSAVHSLNLYTRSSVRTLSEQVLNALSDVLPVSAVQSLQGLSETIREEGSVYYSAADGGTASVKEGNSNSYRGQLTSEVYSVAKSLLEPPKAEVMGFDKGADIFGMLFKPGRGSSTQSPNEALYSMVEDLMSTLTEREEILTPTVHTPIAHDYCIKYYTSKPSQSLSIVNLWVDCLKDSLPSWEGAFCSYNRAINFLACRLPSTAPKEESLIQFSMLGIHKFFLENTETLCQEFNNIIWCNWDKFLDLSFYERSISFFYDEECPWDQFFLKVPECTDNIYKVEAIGRCYNQTTLIKV